VPAARGDAELVTTWSRLRAAGHSVGHIRAQLAARRWRRYGHAIVLHNGPLSRDQRWRVALIHAGPRALLTGVTAVTAYGLRGWEREDVDVLVPRGARTLTSPVPLRVRRVRDWSRVRRDLSRPIQVRPQAVVVAASSFAHWRSACGILVASVQQRIVTPAGLRAALIEAQRTRHRRLLMMTVDDIEQGAQALSEIDFVALCRRYRLPPPQQQAVRQDREGRRRYLDATWRRRDGRLVVVEVDGAVHLDQRRWWDDQLRQNEVTLGDDAIVLRFPSTVVRCQADLIAAQLRRALQL
jgi:hypothetical protein